MKGSWNHPGGKLRELSSGSLSESELLAILISTGIKGKPAIRIAEEVLALYGSLEGLSNSSPRVSLQPQSGVYNT